MKIQVFRGIMNLGEFSSPNIAIAHLEICAFLCPICSAELQDKLNRYRGKPDLDLYNRLFSAIACVGIRFAPAIPYEIVD